ncbi:MAG: transposase [Proteobacteria bacterium]|nr:transposase [Pseudomonadota bacterium]MBS0547792.1 transposase [Pseudomonadota bacterium]
MDHKGWYSRGYLPHFDSPETVQFVTFRLADSLPREVVEALRLEDRAVLKIDRELDSCAGDCWLRRPEIAEIVQGALFHFDGDRYRLLAWCVMPNHVHVVIEPVQGFLLSGIVHSWKSFTANKANGILLRKGAFWHDDYFDRYMRDEADLSRTISYVKRNPVKAGLIDRAEDWLWSSARLPRSF